MKRWRFNTLAIHAGQEPDPSTGAIIVPIFQTSTYVQEGLGKHKGYEYSRTANPTRRALEECLAALEGGRFGLAFASGMAAESTAMNLFKQGDHLIVTDDVYGGTYRLFEKVMRKYGLTFTFVDTSSPEEILKAIRKETRGIWIETPTNPLLKLTDLHLAVGIARKHELISIVDNTFASPYLQSPLEYGVDMVVHSTTKYIGGHSDVVGGAMVTSREDLYDVLKFHQNAVGAVPGPFDSWMVLRGVKTLGVRMEAHQRNAARIARFLSTHRKVRKVYYPGLPAHPQHRLAKKQMRGPGGMIAFEIRGGLKGARPLLTGTKLFSLGESLGGVESLIGHPATMTHASIPKEDREKRGITDGLIRLSVGIEDPEDLLEDLERALEKS